MVADKLQRQEEERIQCSPTSNIDNMVEEEMDISTTHHKRKVGQDVAAQRGAQTIPAVHCRVIGHFRFTARNFKHAVGLYCRRLDAT